MTAIILAAGASQRMGKSKLLLPWGETNVLRHLLGTWKEVGATQIGIVVSRTQPEVKQELEGLDDPACVILENHQSTGDMWSSIQCAARFNSWDVDTSHYVLCLGDQPQLTPAWLTLFLTQVPMREEGVWQPRIDGKGRHPLLFSANCWAELAKKDEGPLHAWLARHPGLVKCIAMQETEMAMDMDTPEDYSARLASWRKSQRAI